MIILLSINVIKCIITMSDVHSSYVPEVKSSSVHTIVLKIDCWIMSIYKYLELMFKNKWIYYFFFSLYLHLGLKLCRMAFHLPFKSYPSLFFCPLSCWMWLNCPINGTSACDFWQSSDNSLWAVVEWSLSTIPSVILFSYKVQRLPPQ